MPSTLIHSIEPIVRTPRSAAVRSSGAGRSPWRDAGPIATMADEVRFVERLERLSGGDVADHNRSDISAVVNALRAGISADALLDRAPGLRPARLLHAYLTLDALRVQAVDAWAAIVSDGSHESLAEHGDEAARLVPVMIQRLRAAATIDPRLLPRVADQLSHEVALVRRAIDGLEEDLDRCVDGGRASDLGATLFDLNSDCMFGRTDHLPVRVGALTPLRVAALLGEHRDDLLAS